MTGRRGVDWTSFTKVSFESVYVASAESDTAASMNAALKKTTTRHRMKTLPRESVEDGAQARPQRRFVSSKFVAWEVNPRGVVVVTATSESGPRQPQPRSTVLNEPPIQVIAALGFRRMRGRFLVVFVMLAYVRQETILPRARKHESERQSERDGERKGGGGGGVLQRERISSLKLLNKVSIFFHV